MESIIEQMMSVAKYLGWDTVELEPVIFVFQKQQTSFVKVCQNVVDIEGHAQRN